MDIRHLQWLMGKLRRRWRNLMAGQQEQCALLGKVVLLCSASLLHRPVQHSQLGMGLAFGWMWAFPCLAGDYLVEGSPMVGFWGSRLSRRGLEQVLLGVCGAGNQGSQWGKAPGPPTTSWVWAYRQWSALSGVLKAGRAQLWGHRGPPTSPGHVLG